MNQTLAAMEPQARSRQFLAIERGPTVSAESFEVSGIRVPGRKQSCIHSIGILAWAALLLLQNAPAIRAQTTQDSIAYATVSARVTPGSPLRVEHFAETSQLLGAALRRDGFRVPGPDLWGVADSVGTHLIPWNEVKRVEIRASAADQGAEGGAALGALVGLGVAAVLVGNFGGGAAEVLAGIPIGGLAGAVVGAVVGAPFRHWHTIYKTSAAW